MKSSLGNSSVKLGHLERGHCEWSRAHLLMHFLQKWFRHVLHLKGLLRVWMQIEHLNSNSYCKIFSLS